MSTTVTNLSAAEMSHNKTEFYLATVWQLKPDVVEQVIDDLRRRFVSFQFSCLDLC
jgi:hypothetical protein